MRQWIRYNQIAHYLMNRSDFEIKIEQKIECFICISKGSLLLKHPVLLENPLPFELQDFQLLTLHSLGSLRNVILLAPTGRGKMICAT